MFSPVRLCGYGGQLIGKCVVVGLAVLQVYAVERVGQRLQGLSSDGRLQLAFPHCDAVPSHFCQAHLLFTVALLVACYLGLPKVRARLGQTKQVAALMPMPETSVYEDNRAELPQHNVWMSRQARMVEPVSESHTEEELAYQYLRLGVLAPYGGHTTVSLLAGHPVHGCSLYVGDAKSVLRTACSLLAHGAAE